VGGTSFFSKLVSFASTLLLAKLLVPYDIGLMAIGSLVIASIGLFRDLGLSRALIFERNDLDEAPNTAFFLIPSLSLGLYFIAFISAPFIASFFKDQHVTLIVRVLAFSLILSSFGEVPATLFEKDIDFRKKSLAEASNLITYGIVSVFFAFLGFSYWSMVIGQISGELARLISVWRISTWRPRFRFNKAVARRLLHYGKHVVGTGVVHFAIRNIDDAFIGRVLDKAALGAYYFAYQIANIPATNVSNVVGRVMFPVYSQLSKDTYDLRNAFFKTLKYTALISLPLAFGIIALSREIMIVLYQDKWIAAVFPIQILAVFGLARSLGSGMGGVFMAVGKPDIMWKISFLQFLILAFFLYPAVKLYGIIGVCVLCDLSMLFSVVAHYLKLKGILKNSHRDILTIIAPIFVFSFVSAAIPKLMAGIFLPRYHALSLAFQCGLMMTLYALQLLTYDKDLRESLRDRLRRTSISTLKEKLLQ